MEVFDRYSMDWYQASSDFHRNLPLARFDSVDFMGFDESLHLVYLRKEIELYLGQEVHSYHSMNFVVETKRLMVEGSFLNIGSLAMYIHFDI